MRRDKIGGRRSKTNGGKERGGEGIIGGDKRKERGKRGYVGFDLGDSMRLEGSNDTKE